jgi:hypothetical protein
MRFSRRILTLCGVLGALGGCSGLYTIRNPYLSYTEEYGVAGTGAQRASSGAAAGAGTEATFRRSLTLRLRNNNPAAELNTTLLCWVSVSSIRSGEQQDALLRDGYVQLTQEQRIGSVFTLPVGTYVYAGGGSGGAMAVFLGPAQGAGTSQGTQGQQQGQTTQGSTTTTSTTTTPTVSSMTLTTPDVILVFSQPPVSCDGVAFYYTQNGAPLPSSSPGGGTAPFAGSNTTGGYKTFAQVDVYQCSPLNPGVFLSQGGSGRQQNEYIEGEDVVFDFMPLADANGNFCTVRFGAAAETILTLTTTTQQGSGTSSSGPSSGGG